MESRKKYKFTHFFVNIILSNEFQSFPLLEILLIILHLECLKIRYDFWFFFPLGLRLMILQLTVTVLMHSIYIFESFIERFTTFNFREID